MAVDARCVRMDDLDRGVGYVFHDPTGGGSADHLHDVRQVLLDAERAAHGGDWVVMVVAYEAAPAFDTALVTHPQRPAGIPLLWWRSYASREECPLPALSGRVPVAEVTRRENRLAYPAAVREIRERIEAGTVYQVNHTDRFSARLTGSVQQVYAGLLGAQAAAYGALIDLEGATLASASPELFFRWDGDIITCRPMKGTAARSDDPAVDEAAAADLCSSAKEQAENLMIVDLMRNDLTRIAEPGSVRTTELFALEEYATVWQLTSTVQARVRPETSLTDVFAALFPCGSVTGAPKVTAMQTIADLESEPRGAYCGAIGFLSPPGGGPRAVFSVPIRTAVIRGGELTYGAGAGVTWSSDPGAEDAEVDAKATILGRRSDRWIPVDGEPSADEFDLLETLLLTSEGPQHLARHLRRMRAAAEFFGRSFDVQAAQVAVAEIGVVDRPHRLRLRCLSDGEIKAEVGALESLPGVTRLGVDSVASCSRDPFRRHKTTWRDHYASARARFPDADDVVLVNERGAVMETTIANLAVKLDGQWWTPSLDSGCLPGIGRAMALQDGWLAERDLYLSELSRAEELATVSSLRSIQRCVLVVN